jgi:DNA-binding CsgD family transcriptional regulator
MAASAAHIAQMYALTRAEARLVSRLMESRTLLDAADSLAITEATARTLLGRVFTQDRRVASV